MIYGFYLGSRPLWTDFQKTGTVVLVDDIIIQSNVGFNNVRGSDL